METVELNKQYIGGQVRYVRDTIREWDLADLSAKLSDLGFNLGKNALSKLETGQRNMTAEELVAIAVALDVTPNRLLLGGSSPDDMGQVVRIANTWEITLAEAWAWASGEELPDSSTPGADKSWSDHLRADKFRVENRPHRPPTTLAMDQYRDLVELGVFNAVTEAVRRVESMGYSSDVIVDHIETMGLMDALERAARRKIDEDAGDAPEA